jgi:murein DD-endopeptidase MepM/ murein hydrolase activator NlpD
MSLIHSPRLPSVTTARYASQRHDDVPGTCAEPTRQDAILLGQRTLGNQAVLRALTGASADSAEREANRIGDSVADAATRTAGSAVLSNVASERRGLTPRERLEAFLGWHLPASRVPVGVGAAEETRKRGAGAVTGRRDEPPTGEVADTVPRLVHEVLSSPGRPLDAGTLFLMERRFSRDFSRVRLHSGATAEQSARDLNAQAYTVGTNIVFGAGQLAPETPRGQRLIAHELTHVVQQSGSTPAVQRQPDPAKKGTPGKKTPAAPAPKPRDAEAEVRAIMSGRSAPKAKKDLGSWLDTHPADVAVAERVLLDRAAAATGEREWELLGDLLGEVFARDPHAEAPRVALRDQAEASTNAVWEQYASAAAIAAIYQWAGDSSERNRLLSKLSTKEEKANRAKQLSQLRNESSKLLVDLRTERTQLMKNMQHSLAVLPLRASASFTPVPEQDLVSRLLHQMERGIAHAEGIRRQTYEAFSARTPERETTAEIARLDKQRDEAEANVSAAHRELDDAKKLSGAGVTAKVGAATAKVKKAEDRKKAIAAGRAKATPAAARTIKYREDPQETKRVDAALDEFTRSRNAFLGLQAAKLPSFKSLADDGASWWVYWQFIKNARDGFEGFAMESTLRPALLARNKMISRPETTGIQASTSPDTYSGHGWGQYDLNAPAGTKIDVIEPPGIDLSQVLGGKPRMFEWIGSRVSTVFGQDPRQTEKDVLDKLAYGFFGRDRAFEKKIEQADLDKSGLPENRTPEPNRLVAGLLYRSTVAGGELEIEDQLVALRSDLEVLLEDSPEFAGLRVDENEEILTETFDASAGDFGTANLLNRAAFVAAGTRGGIPASALTAFNAAITRILKEDSSFTRAVFTLMKTRLEDLRSQGGVEAGHLGVLDWAGPSVYVLHHYRLKGGAEEAWIRVIYLHLHKVDASVGKMSKDPLTVGEVGSGGNAISPHVHMSIAIFRTEPSWNTPPVDYIDPTDFFGMVPRTPFKTAP